jgi:hypothetical protein
MHVKEFVAMKKALAGVLVASLLGLMATGAMAQSTPYFQVYFDNNFQTTQSVCGAPLTLAQLYVVMHNFPPYPIAGAAFSIDYPPALSWISEAVPAGVKLGDSRSDNPGPGLGGVTIGFGYGILSPGILALTVNCAWTYNCDCYSGSQALVVRGYRYNDPNGTADPVGVTDETFDNLPAVGMTSLICGQVAAESSTWGAVKALYR